MKKQFIQTMSYLVTGWFGALIIVSCSETQPRTSAKFGKALHSSAPSWAQRVNEEVLKLGNFNWIVIAEPSFSALNRDGLTIISVDRTSTEVLEQVFQSLDRNAHVRSKIYLSSESKALVENDTPGIEIFKKKRDQVLDSREARYLANDALELLLTDAEEKYQILIIKTNTLLPYSSIFLELESGYWDGESETALRKRMIR